MRWGFALAVPLGTNPHSARPASPHGDAPLAVNAGESAPARKCHGSANAASHNHHVFRRRFPVDRRRGQFLHWPHRFTTHRTSGIAFLHGITTMHTPHRPHAWHRLRTAAAAPCLLAAGSAWGCWQEAAERYNVNPHVLHAIAKCESSLNPKAMNRSHIERTGTYDIGLMQINSSNLRGLRQHGIGEAELLDACTSINVGAWILAQKIQRHGHTWEAVGAYNAACTQLKGEACTAARTRYARCVYRNLPPELKGDGEHGEPAAARARPKPTAPAAPAVAPLVAVKVMP
jgi:hypothetical protein